MTVSLAALESAAALGWRAPEEARLGDWLLRAAEGFTGRANSALAVGDPGLPLADAADEIRAWYAARGLPAMIAVPHPLGQPDGSPVDRALGELGWTVRRGPAVVMTATLGETRRTGGAEVRVELADKPDDSWLGNYRYRGEDLPPIARQLLMSAPWQAFASVREDGRTIAIGRVATALDWAGLTAVEVDPEHRRRGLASAVVAALVSAAAGRGVAGLYLQVETANTGARALYARIGFADHHGYHYRVAPA
jgi:ribosomal protein S18 acetylase RimI-like enzyme